MTLFEIIIICIVAAMFVATIFVFLVCIPYIKQVYRLNQQVVTLTNAAYECRSFLEKVSKHEVITKINKITDLEKKVGGATYRVSKLNDEGHFEESQTAITNSEGL